MALDSGSESTLFFLQKKYKMFTNKWKKFQMNWNAMEFEDPLEPEEVDPNGPCTA